MRFLPVFKDTLGQALQGLAGKSGLFVECLSGSPESGTKVAPLFCYFKLHEWQKWHTKVAKVAHKILFLFNREFIIWKVI